MGTLSTVVPLWPLSCAPHLYTQLPPDHIPWGSPMATCAKPPTSPVSFLSKWQAIHTAVQIKPRGLSWYLFVFTLTPCMHVNSLQSCLTLCSSMDHSPPGSSIHGIPQARILEWVAMPSSRGSSQPRKIKPTSLRSPVLAGSLPLEGFPGGSDGKAFACNAGDLGSIPGSGRSLEKAMAPHSSTVAWKIPWTEEPGRLQSTGSQRVRHDWATSLHFTSSPFIHLA